jgi:hypothetical protein
MLRQLFCSHIHCMEEGAGVTGGEEAVGEEEEGEEEEEEEEDASRTIVQSQFRIRRYLAWLIEELLTLPEFCLVRSEAVGKV